MPGTPVKVLARDWLFHVNTGTDASPTWVQVKGINNHSWSETKNDADTTDYDNDGWLAHIPASRGKSVTLSGYYMEDGTPGGTRDPGQAAAETWANAMGPNGIRKFKVTTPGNTTIIGSASAKVSLGGGGNDDASGWELEVTYSGQVTIVTAA